MEDGGDLRIIVVEEIMGKQLYLNEIRQNQNDNRL
jgi:hypothetical protein